MNQLQNYFRNHILKYRLNIACFFLATTAQLNLCCLVQHCSAQTPAAKSTPVATESDAGRISKVTLYRDQALVTREISVKASPNEREILVGQLPDQVLVESVFAEGLGSVEVRGVRVGRRVAGQEVNAEVKELTARVLDIDRQLSQLKQKLTSNRKQMEYVDRLMNFTAVSTSSDLARGVLDAQSLTSVSEFSLEKQKGLSEANYQVEQEIQTLTAEQSSVQQQLGMLKSDDQPVFEATVVVASDKDGVFELSYLVSNCSWEPSYTILGALGSDQFDVRYNALIKQMSGETWNNVRLTLSTASPSINAAGPSLTPFRISIAAQEAKSGKPVSTNAMAPGSQSLPQKQRAVADQFSVGLRDNELVNRDLALNQVANDHQNYELLADAAQLKSLAADAGAEISSQTYDIAKPVRLASRREHHNVLISQSKLKGELYHVATPLLSSFAYREAQMKNTRAEGYLGGPAAVYLDNKFVGRTDLPTVASGQLMIVGFGADQQVRTRRELINKLEDVQGGNRKLTFKYRLVVANFKSTPIKLRLIDRLPLAGQGADVRIEYETPNPTLSADGLYNRIQRPRGILRWDIEVPAERFGEKAHDVDYIYNVSFDRTLQIANQLAKTQMQQDLFESAAPSSPMSGGMGGMGGGMGGMGGGMGGMGRPRSSAGGMGGMFDAQPSDSSGNGLKNSKN